MPTLSAFYGGPRPQVRLPVVISRDATGKGNLKFTTAAARSPWMSKSAQQLHIFGFGLCGDDRSGSERLFGPNLEVVNCMVEAAAEDRCSPCPCPDGQQRDILVDPRTSRTTSPLFATESIWPILVGVGARTMLHSAKSPSPTTQPLLRR